MKRVSCPKCGAYITFNENAYPAGRILVFECPACKKQFKVRCTPAADTAPEEAFLGKVIVVANTFHRRQEIALRLGDNVFGRYVKGTSANAAIETADPSIDTTHCIIQVRPNKRGTLQYILRDAPSGTGTFHQDQILRDQDRINLNDGDIITIGATTLILQLSPDTDQ